MSPSQSDRTRRPSRASAAPIGEGDAALVAALRDGSREAHGVLIERYAGDVERVLMRVLGPDRDLDDLLHDVLLAALTSMHTLQDPTKLRSWLVSIAINKARKCLRTRRRWRFIRFLQPSDVPEREASAVPAEVSEALASTYAVLDSMPVDDRVFFALRFIDGMELTAIAAQSGVSLATVKRRLARARATFLRAARAHPALDEWIEPESSP